MNYLIFLLNSDLRKLFLTGAFLVTILSTVTPNKNASKKFQNSNITANVNVTSLNITEKEIYDTYADPELQRVWGQYLAEVQWFAFTHHKDIKYKWTTVMGKESTVTETIKAREISNDIGRMAASNTKFTPTPGARPYEIGNNRTVYVMRRQVTRFFTQGKDPNQDAIDQLLRKDAIYRFEGFRQPYWKGGDYVFLRTGSPTPKTQRWDKNTLPIMQVYRGCDRSCNYYFRAYGKVCGHRYNMKRYSNDYKDFENICDIDHENCSNKHHKPGWHPLYRGPCAELRPFKKMEYDYMDVVWRGKNWAPYVYTPRRRTQSTADPVDLEIEELQKEQKKNPLDRLLRP